MKRKRSNSINVEHSSCQEALTVSIDSNDSCAIDNLQPLSPVHIDFDDLKNDVMGNADPSAFDDILSNIDGLDTDAIGTAADENDNINPSPIESADDDDSNENHDIASDASTHETKISSSASIEGKLGGIKLVPIESLMQSTVDSKKITSEKKVTVKCHSPVHVISSESESRANSSSSKSNSSDSDSDNSDDDDRHASKSRPTRHQNIQKNLKKRFKLLRQRARTKRHNYAEPSNSDESDENNDDGNDTMNESTRKNRGNTAASASTSSAVTPPKNIYSATIKLTKLPLKNMKPLLFKYNLIEIRDRHQKVLASRPRMHRNEKLSKSESKRPLNDGNCETSDENVDNQLTHKSVAKKQKLNENTESSTRSQRKSDKNKPPLRKQKQKPRYVISSDSSSNNDSSVSDKNTDDSDFNQVDESSTRRSTRNMRKKNVPKSSTDVTDSNNSASENNNSDNEQAENNGAKSSGSEVEVRAKRKRIPVKRHQPSDDDDDDEYSEPKKKYKRRKRIKKVSDSSDENTPKKSHGRKNIRKVIRTADLEQETKEAAKHEIERKKRIEERQKLYNQMYDKKSEDITELDKLVLDFDPETKEELISVDKKLVKKLKPHQGQGVKFMWDASFESIEKLNENYGGGCILAHCMGLGKTLQVVALVHTLLTHSEQTNVEKVLIICPVSTVLNWVNEFKIWLRHCSENRNIEIYEISKYKQNTERAYRISEWHNDGGVLILGYDMFRNLSSETNRIRKKQKEIFQEGLINPGPDLVVCDEGHLLKNAKTSLSKAVNRLTTMRRIVLTGTPLQNNLNEYYCMVQFVKPNLLGKYNEYLNRFVNPITNGQYTDSTPYDIQMMKRRSHILHKLLDGCVQRRDYAVLAPFLPQKQEYVLYVRLTKLQVDFKPD